MHDLKVRDTCICYLIAHLLLGSLGSEKVKKCKSMIAAAAAGGVLICSCHEMCLNVKRRKQQTMIT